MVKRESSDECVDIPTEQSGLVKSGQKACKRNELDFPVSSHVVEVSDADYRSLHLPCDELGESSKRNSGS